MPMLKHVLTMTGVLVILYLIVPSHATVVSAAVKILNSHAPQTHARLPLKVEVMTSFEVVSYTPWMLPLYILNVKPLVKESVRMLKYSAPWLEIVYAMGVRPTLRCTVQPGFYVLVGAQPLSTWINIFVKVQVPTCTVPT